MFLLKKLLSIPLIRLYFSFKGRINRKRYFLASVALGIFSGLLLIESYYAILFLLDAGKIILADVLTFLAILLCLLMGVADISLMTRRLHDMGYTAAPIICLIYGLSLLAPGLDSLFHLDNILADCCSLFNAGCSLYLFCGKGNQSANQFGIPN